MISTLTELRLFKYQSHPVSLWRWQLSCDLEKCYLLRSSVGMYNLEKKITKFAFIDEIFIAHATRSRSQTHPNMNIAGEFYVTLWRQRWRHHHEK